MREVGLDSYLLLGAVLFVCGALWSLTAVCIIIERQPQSRNGETSRARLEQ